MGSFFYLAEILKTVGHVDQSAQPVLVALATSPRRGYSSPMAFSPVAAVVGFVWLTVAIARGKTLYPRWVAFANPLVCMGIGLSVSRSIIERHHGRPWAEPNDGGPGATFSFWIPRQGQSLEAAPVASTS